MTPVQYLLIGFVGVGLLIGLTWRLLSRRHELPCPSWLAWLVELDNPFLKIYHADEIINNLGIAPGMRVLDAGCGPGRLSIPAAEKVGEFGEVWALDIQDKMLDRVREKIHRAGIENVHILQAELGSGALPDDYFDRVLLVTVLGEIPEQQEALKEIHRSLNPGGILSVTEVIVDPHFQRREAVLQVASMAGFREIKRVGSWYAYTLHLEKSSIKTRPKMT